MPNVTDSQSFHFDIGFRIRGNSPLADIDGFKGALFSGRPASNGSAFGAPQGLKQADVDGNGTDAPPAYSQYAEYADSQGDDDAPPSYDDAPPSYDAATGQGIPTAASLAKGEKKLEAMEGKLIAGLEKQASADEAAGAADGAADTNPASSATPQQNAQTLQNGDATGDPPADLTLPPDTDVNSIIGANGGLIDKLNWHNTQGGVPVGDALAAKESGGKYTTMAALESAAKSGDPEARNDLAKVAWAAQACNNVTEQDGALRPDDERHASTLAGYTSLKGGVANHGTPAGIMQDYLQSGQSITGQTTLATERTYADGTPKSNGTIIGEKIAGFFEKLFSFICPPVSDLIKMAVDGATEIRDKNAGDADAAHNDAQAVKEDGENFGKDFAMTLVSLAGGPEMAEIGNVVRGIANGVKDGVEAAAKGATRVGEDAAKGTERAADALSSMDLGSLAGDILEQVAQKLGLGDTKEAVKGALDRHPHAANILDEIRGQAQGFLQGQVSGYVQVEVQGQMPPSAKDEQPAAAA